MKRTVLLVAAYSIFAITAFAQEGRLLFNRLTLQDGLSEASNPAIFLDSKGFVWISSVGGLNRFDGTEVKVYTDNPDDSCSMKGNLMTGSFFEDTSSMIWFTTMSGMNAYNWNTDCFLHYDIPTGTESDAGYYAFYLDPDQNIWLIIGKFLYTFNIPTATFHQIGLTEVDVNKALACTDVNGHIQIWTYHINEAGAEQFTLNAKHEVISKEIVWHNIASKPFLMKDMICQGDSLIWALSDDGIWKYNIRKNEGQWMPLRQNEATSFEFLDDHTLLVGFKKKGLWEFSLEEEKLTYQYTHLPDNNASLLSNSVDEINRDSQGNIWVSSWGIGISYTQPKKGKFNTFYPRDLLTGIQSFNPIALVPVGTDVLMCATRTDGFYYLHRKKVGPPEITTVPHLDSKSVPGNVGDVFKDEQGYFWISSFPGLSVFDPSTGNTRSLIIDKTRSLHGIPWKDQSRLFSGSGIFEVKGNMMEGFTIEKNQSKLDTASSSIMWEDSRHRIWAGIGMQNVLVLDAHNFNVLANFMEIGICSKIIERDSINWLCGSNGLFEINAATLSVEKVHNKKSGMPSDGFNSMEMDPNKRLWLTFNKGVVMYDPADERIRTFSQGDGLPPLQFRHASYQFADGEIWFAANEGVTRFYPDRVHDLEIPAKPQITDIQVNDKIPQEKLICDISGTSNVPLIQKLIFHYKENTLAFRVSALEYSSPRRTKVKYQMEGLDNQPVETSSGSFIRYPNMPYGNYKLVVYAYNSDGVYNPIPREMLIRIIPPYYKTWWFYTLVALSFFGIIAYIIYLRFTKALELQRVRLKLYENLHDDVGSRLTAIVLSAEDLERNEKINHPKIQSISKIAKSIVENMRRLVWAIDPENDKISTIVQKITHDKSLILGDHISFKMEVDDHLKNVVVPGEIRYQISSICNEAFNNISKYAQATEVKVDLSREHRKFQLTITDNGKGFDPDAVSKNNLTGSGYGLNNMKRRASRVKGNLQIFSKPGEGTRIVADFPY